MIKSICLMGKSSGACWFRNRSFRLGSWVGNVVSLAGPAATESPECVKKSGVGRVTACQINARPNRPSGRDWQNSTRSGRTKPPAEPNPVLRNHRFTN
jgi:hypothetical protein